MFLCTGSVMEAAAHLKRQYNACVFAWTPSDSHREPRLMRISQWCQVKGAELCMILHQDGKRPVHHYETLFC